MRAKGILSLLDHIGLYGTLAAEKSHNEICSCEAIGDKLGTGISSGSRVKIWWVLYLREKEGRDYRNVLSANSNDGTKWNGRLQVR